MKQIMVIGSGGVAKNTVALLILTSGLDRRRVL